MVLKNPRAGEELAIQKPCLYLAGLAPTGNYVSKQQRNDLNLVKVWQPDSPKPQPAQSKPQPGPSTRPSPFHGWAKSSFPPQNHSGKSWKGKGAKGTQTEERVALAEQDPRPQGAVTCTLRGVEGLGSALFAGGTGRGRRR